MFSAFIIVSLCLACTKEESTLSDNSNVQFVPDPEYVLTEADRKINTQIFEVLNLDYPGLATVRQEYLKKHYANAAKRKLYLR